MNDSIYRQAAIDAIVNTVSHIVDVIKQLPSALAEDLLERRRE